MTLPVVALMREAAERFVLPQFRCPEGLHVQEKTPGDLVTMVDLRVEAFLHKHLTRLCDIPFIGEESWDEKAKASLGRGNCWVVDPIDGTRAFVEGDDRFAMIVARIAGGQCEEGWLFFPAKDELFYAKRGQGIITFNKSVASVNKAVSPGRYRLTWVATEQRDQLELRLRSAGWTLDSPTCWELRRLLVGEPGGYLCSHVTPWDMAAGVLLVSEAGGSVFRSDGETPVPTDEVGLYIFAPDVATASEWISTFELSQIRTLSPIRGVTS